VRSRRSRLLNLPQTQSETLAWNLGRDLEQRAGTDSPPGCSYSPEVSTWLTASERQAFDRLGPELFVAWAQQGWENRQQVRADSTDYREQ
jgi:hypothetical protein